MGQRLEPKERKQAIMDVAIKQAQRDGYLSLTRHELATGAQCAPSLVSRYWGTMEQLKRAVMREAVKRDNLEIIAQGLASRDSIAKKAKPEIRQQALELLA